MTALASVLVPAYQAERYIDEAIASALAQTYEAVEVIVADDGSTDGTASLAERRGIRTLRCPHRGPAAARNAALAVSRGVYVTVLDADDVWPTDRLARQIAYLDEHPEHDLVLGLTEVFGNPGEDRPLHYPLVPGGQPLPAVAGTMLARRSAFDRIGPWDERLLLAEDIDWLARAKDAGLVAGAIDEVVLRYRIHEHNTTRNTLANRAALLTVLRGSVQRQRTGPR